MKLERVALSLDHPPSVGVDHHSASIDYIFAIIPVEEVRAGFFGHLNTEIFARKIAAGEIELPVMRIESSQKSPRLVSLRALATYIDERARQAELVISAPRGR